MQRCKILWIIVLIYYHSQQFRFIEPIIICLTQLIPILFILIYDIGQNTHILNEKCHFRQIIITDTIIPTSFLLKCRLELILRIGWIDYRYYCYYEVKELCSFLILKDVIFNRIDKSNMSAYYF